MITRILVATPVSVLVTLSLFYLMHTLIVTGRQAITEVPRLPPIGLARVREETPVTPEVPPRFQELKDNVIITPPREQLADEFGEVRLVVPMIDPAPTFEQTPFGERISDSPLVAVVRVQPVYPASAASRNLEGYVVVQFDVEASGGVSNVIVLESSHKVFEKAAIEAALRFRFNPKVADGVAVATRGLVNRFTFRMERG